MRAAVLTGIGQVTIEDRPEPAARPGWVVVAVESASLCGTDSHQFDGRIDTPFPRVPGHDFAGRVDEVGDGVDPSLVGMPVAVKPSLPSPTNFSRVVLSLRWSAAATTAAMP